MDVERCQKRQRRQSHIAPNNDHPRRSGLDQAASNHADQNKCHRRGTLHQRSCHESANARQPRGAGGTPHKLTKPAATQGTHVLSRELETQEKQAEAKYDAVENEHGSPKYAAPSVSNKRRIHFYREDPCQFLSPSLPIEGILTRRLACELLEGFCKVELVVETKHLGQFLVGEPVAGEELPCTLDAPRHGVAGRGLACDIGEFFSKTLVAHPARLRDIPKRSLIVRRRPLQKVRSL